MVVVSVNGKGIRSDLVKKLVEDSLKEKYPDASVSVHRKEPAESRDARFSEAQDYVSLAKSTAELLKEELENWLESLPENLQNGSKADELNDAICSLEDFISGLEQAEGVDVSFPGMFS